MFAEGSASGRPREPAPVVDHDVIPLVARLRPVPDAQASTIPVDR